MTRPFHRTLPYRLLTFEWKLSQAELVGRAFSFYDASEGLLTETEIVNERDQATGQSVRVLNRVSFSQPFIESLRQRTVFELEWSKVRSVALKYSSRKYALSR